MTRLEHQVRVRTASVFVLAAVLVASTGVHAADGTIHFTGEIVAAPYSISSTPTTPATMATRIRKAGSTSDVIFQRQYIDRPSASVRVDALGGLPLELAFTDARGQRHAFDSKDARAVGQDGGTLSIRRQGSSTGDSASRVTAALVTVIYN
ncbi:MAG TPA: hypothetical protein VF555_17330 [Variovorax sp.]